MSTEADPTTRTICTVLAKSDRYRWIHNSVLNILNSTFSNKDFFSKCDQIHTFLQNRAHLLKKSFTENFIFCVVLHPYVSQADGFDILVDLPVYENPSNLFHAAVQPDLVLKRNHHIIIIELTCCFKTNLLHSRNFKIEKYKTFKRHSDSYSQQN